MTAITIMSHPLPAGTLVRVEGDVDITNSDQLETALQAGRVSGKSLILDLSAMTFLDSTGLSVLLNAHTAVEESGGRLCLAAVQHTPMRVLKITGVLARLHLHATVEEAVTACAARSGTS